MCKCRFLEEANLDGYMLDNLIDGEMAARETSQATLDDFANTVDRLSRKPENIYLICHLYDLMQVMHREDCFFFMDTDPDTYIRGMLELHGLNLAHIVSVACRSKYLH